MDVRPLPADGEAARLLLADYLAEIERRLGRPLEPSEYPDAEAAELEPPHGRLLAAFDGAAAVACGAVRVIAPGVAEIKRMYVSPRARGRGLGRTLLRELEAGAVELGCHTVRLDTMTAMAEAAALYRSAGYGPIADYNGNPLAGVWMERRLG
jgi:ribosomal protein S18 acetylase RimI-like enzyme